MDPPPDPSLSNADLAPTRVAERTWGTHHIASLWVGLSVCIPTYMLAASLVGGGMNGWPAILTIMLGNLISRFATKGEFLARVVRRAKLALPELYRRDGISGRINDRALAALAAGTPRSRSPAPCEICLSRLSRRTEKPEVSVRDRWERPHKAFDLHLPHGTCCPGGR